MGVVNKAYIGALRTTAYSRMSSRSPSPRTVSLSLPPDERWTLHHVLLDRIEQETAREEDSDPPPIEVFQAFETLDRGETSLTVSQLRAIESVLADYQRTSSWWEVERQQIERLLQRVSDAIGDRQLPSPK